MARVCGCVHYRMLYFDGIRIGVCLMMLRWRGCALRNVPTLGRRHKTGGRQGGQPCLTDAGDDHFNDEKMNQPDDDDDDIDEG